ncbi:U-box domain-containing protein 4-like [Salvia splendens]|uniref:U-box domain-containing protein 4-like n=1 Tax=Salvia splendens TaxID=180675 RepID=UPI001C25FE36|nr:U-box domain-containing protein 4-like [Salvia splendens]
MVEENSCDLNASSAAKQTLMLLQSEDPACAVQAAKEIRRLTKTSQCHRRHFSAAVAPLVDMLRGGSDDAREAALAALLNLAVRDDENKMNIINEGALKPIMSFLESTNATVQEHATAALVTLSASSNNKPIIAASGAIPLLIDALHFGGSSQARSDAAMALYNLSTDPENVPLILHAQPIPPLIDLLKSCKKSSKAAEKCVALIESAVAFEEGRRAVVAEEGGILAVVEVVEGGTGRGREHGVGALLRMCESDEGGEYRDAILGEGVIPGVMELTVEGSRRCQGRAQELLRLLRDPRPEMERGAVLYGEVKRVGKANKMAQVSMEQSFRDIKERAVLCASHLSS